MLRKEIAGLQESIAGYEAQAQSTQQRLALFARGAEGQAASCWSGSSCARPKSWRCSAPRPACPASSASCRRASPTRKERIARAEQQIAQLRSAAMQKAIEELRADRDASSTTCRSRSAPRATSSSAPRCARRCAASSSSCISTRRRRRRGRRRHPRAAAGQRRADHRGAPQPERRSAHVKTGQHALVRLTALNQRLTPDDRRQGDLSLGRRRRRAGRGRAAASRRPPQRAILRRARAARREGRRAARSQSFQPTPGMPADVFIKTGERTFFDYIMRPVWTASRARSARVDFRYTMRAIQRSVDWPDI